MAAGPRFLSVAMSLVYYSRDIGITSLAIYFIE
jgi:hypothetical protein